MALIGGGLLLVISGLFGGARKLDEDQLAAVELETIVETFRLRAEQNWPNDVSASDQVGDVAYKVEDLGMIADPLGSPEPLP
ncbi:MAG: hypothetical protein KC910_37445, partial [Candidatus Eremiobacteraeota bacterium]|nr:hypothetical protein [Candidatus Eremiobacteraeota bacterium]